VQDVGLLRVDEAWKNFTKQVHIKAADACAAGIFQPFMLQARATEKSDHHQRRQAALIPAETRHLSVTRMPFLSPMAWQRPLPKMCQPRPSTVWWVINV